MGDYGDSKRAFGVIWDAGWESGPGPALARERPGKASQEVARELSDRESKQLRWGAELGVVCTVEAGSKGVLQPRAREASGGGIPPWGVSVSFQGGGQPLTDVIRAVLLSPS